MTPARRGRRSHRDEGDDASVLPGQEGSDGRLEKGSDNQHVVGGRGACDKARGWGGGRRPPRLPSKTMSLALAGALRRRSSQGWTFGRAAPRRRLRRQAAAATKAGGGDDVALAATRAGDGRRDESGRGVEEDAVTTAAGMLTRGGGGSGRRDYRGGGGRREASSSSLRRTTTTSEKRGVIGSHHGESLCSLLVEVNIIMSTLLQFPNRLISSFLGIYPARGEIYLPFFFVPDLRRIT